MISDASGARTPRRRHDVRERRRRLVTYALLIVSGVLMVNALVGENGYLATVRARHERAGLLGSIAKLRLENHALEEEQRRLKTDPAAVEEAARRDLGLIRPGETLIVIRDTVPGQRGTGPAPR